MISQADPFAIALALPAQARAILATMPVPIPTPKPTTKAATTVGNTPIVSGGPSTGQAIPITPGINPSEYTTYDPVNPTVLTGLPIYSPTGANPTANGAPSNQPLTTLVQPPGVYVPNPTNVAPTVGAGVTSPTQGNVNLNPTATAGTPAVTTMAGTQGGVTLGGVTISNDWLIGGGLVLGALVITLLATRKRGA